MKEKRLDKFVLQSIDAIEKKETLDWLEGFDESLMHKQ